MINDPSCYCSVPVENVVESLEPTCEGVSEFFCGEPCSVYVNCPPYVLFDVVCDGNENG